MEHGDTKGVLEDVLGGRKAGGYVAFRKQLMAVDVRNVGQVARQANV